MKRLLVALPLVLFAAHCTCTQPPGAPAGAPCETAVDCQGDLVCDPDTDTCGTVACTTHEACGDGAVCTDGACVDNAPGGACDVDANCVNSESCRDGVCHTQGSAGAPCTTAAGCALPLVCEPGTGVCTADVACSEHAGCGVAAHCADGACVPSTSESPCSTDAQCVAGDHCVGVVCVPAQCQGEAFNAEPHPANLMIAIDRSGSMNDDLGSEGSKWDVARSAVYDVLEARRGAIYFGLSPFPGDVDGCRSDSEDCSGGAIAVDIGPNNEDAIRAYLEDSPTCHGTPIAEEMSLLVSYAGLKDATRANYVLLLTDGKATCDAPTPVVESLHGQAPPVVTFVVGFGDGVDPDELSAMAVAGGAPGSADGSYYQADNAASLQAALQEITGAVLSCDYTLTGNGGSDPDQLAVYFNGIRVPRDSSGAAGWDYTPATNVLSFAGNACTALQTGSVTDLTIVYGCPLAESHPDAGVPDVDAGNPPPPPVDAGPNGCTDRCDGACGTQACLIPPGQNTGTCGSCGDDTDCCPGSICIASSGACLFIGG